MTTREPLVSWSFPTTGEVYLVLRPTGAFADAFSRLAAEARELVPDARLAGAHVTLKGWGDEQRPTDDATERAIADAVQTWAQETPPLRLHVSSLAVFEEERIPVFVIEPTRELREAQGRIRERSDQRGLPTNASDSIHDWVFHASLGYLDELEDGDWRRLRRWWTDVEVPDVECLATAAELVGYDGGPERLLGAMALVGRSGGVV